ncbi:MAG: YwaF family protein [Clostridia bacterium]|nr:YwaF family protein [Clostridia bacterium]
MNEFIRKILSTKTGSVSIDVFDPWHIAYIILIIGGGIALSVYYKNKPTEVKTKFLNILAIALPCVYILDFFLMPLAGTGYSGYIDKLPFHICTFMSIWVPFAQFNKKFEKVKDVICCLTLVASLMYITYPGSALGDILPWSYKVIQTFVFHGLMFIWSLVSIATDMIQLDIRKIWKEAVALAGMTAWALIGNYMFDNWDGEGGGYDWFFVKGGLIGIDETPWGPFVMPLLVFIAIFAMCAIIHGLNICLRKIFTTENSEYKTA